MDTKVEKEETEINDPHHDIAASFNNFSRTEMGHKALDKAVKTIKDEDEFTNFVKHFFMDYLQRTDEPIYLLFTPDEYIEEKGGEDFVFSVEFAIADIFFNYVTYPNMNPEEKADHDRRVSSFLNSSKGDDKYDTPETRSSKKGGILKWAIPLVAVAGLSYIYSQGISTDEKMTKLQIECDKGLVNSIKDSCFDLSRYYLTSKSIPEERLIGKGLLEKSCEKGFKNLSFPDGCIRLAEDGLWKDEGKGIKRIVKEKIPTAREYYRKSCVIDTAHPYLDVKSENCKKFVIYGGKMKELYGRK